MNVMILLEIVENKKIGETFSFDFLNNIDWSPAIDYNANINDSIVMFMMGAI